MPRKRTNRAHLLGVDDDTYHAMLFAQGGGCAVCGSTPKARRLHVDDDHKTRAVRGLLCLRCNRSLPAGMTAERLRALADYLDNPPGIPYAPDAPRCGLCGHVTRSCGCPAGLDPYSDVRSAAVSAS